MGGRAACDFAGAPDFTPLNADYFSRHFGAIKLTQPHVRPHLARCVSFPYCLKTTAMEIVLEVPDKDVARVLEWVKGIKRVKIK